MGSQPQLDSPLRLMTKIIPLVDLLANTDLSMIGVTGVVEELDQLVADLSIALSVEPPSRADAYASLCNMADAYADGNITQDQLREEVRNLLNAL